ncbi:MAG: hypothetical protein ABI282_08100 [Candidatus Baltobacteraceae bacterium]
MFAIVAILAVAASQMQSLGYFAGAWTCSGVFPQSGKAISSRMTFGSDLKGLSLVKHHDDDLPFDYHAVELWTYSAADKRFEAAAVDPYSGVREFISDGFAGERLVWASAPWMQPAQSFVYRKIDQGNFVVDYHVHSKAGDIVVDTLHCVRDG